MVHASGPAQRDPASVGPRGSGSGLGPPRAGLGRGLGRGSGSGAADGSGPRACLGASALPPPRASYVPSEGAPATRTRVTGLGARLGSGAVRRRRVGPRAGPLVVHSLTGARAVGTGPASGEADGGGLKGGAPGFGGQGRTRRDGAQAGRRGRG